jgi:predicted membrane chloride channel (bestrophin family)
MDGEVESLAKLLSSKHLFIYTFHYSISHLTISPFYLVGIASYYLAPLFFENNPKYSNFYGARLQGCRQRFVRNSHTHTQTKKRTKGTKRKKGTLLPHNH